MNFVGVQLAFFLLFVIVLFAYLEGKKQGLYWLISFGRRNMIVLGFLFIVYNLVIGVKDF